MDKNCAQTAKLLGHLLGLKAWTYSQMVILKVQTLIL